MILFCIKNNTVKKDLKFPRQNFQARVHHRLVLLVPCVVNFSLFSPEGEVTSP